MRGHSSTNEAVHVVPIAARQLGLGAPAGVPGRNVRKRRGDPDSPVRAIRLKGDGVGAIIFQYCIVPPMGGRNAKVQTQHTLEHAANST
jgi:hypothetical protein